MVDGRGVGRSTTSSWLPADKRPDATLNLNRHPYASSLCKREQSRSRVNNDNDYQHGGGHVTKVKRAQQLLRGATVPEHAKWTENWGAAVPFSMGSWVPI